jgi:flagellar hook-associated protein 1 FlgK
MSGLTGAINTALSGIEAYETGIAAVSENLANAAASGYAVESVDLSTATSTPGQAGTGVNTATISRAADGFTAGLLRTANSAAQAASTSSTALGSISAALENNGDIQTSIDQFFTDISTLATNPSSAAARQTVLSDAQNITGTFQSAASSIGDVMTGATTALQQNVTSANSLLGQLATINKNLQTAPNDPSLLDQQEAALNSLSDLLPVNVLPQSDGGVLITTGGAVLLDQSGAQDLTLTGGTGSTAPSVTAGTSATPIATGDTAGSIGGNLASWQAGAQALAGINGLATVFAATVNTAQAEGLTSTGTPGAALFSVPAPSVTAAAANTGSATLTAQLSSTAALPADGGPFSLAFSSTGGWSATDQSSGTSYPVTTDATTGNLSFAGMTVAVSGTAASGDRFTVNPAPAAAAGISVNAIGTAGIAAADPYVTTAGTTQSDGSTLDSNTGTATTGTDTVTTTPASNAAVVPASYYGQALQINFTSPTAYTVSTAAAPTVAIASGTLTNGSGNVAVAYPAGAASGSYVQLPITGTPAAGDVLTLSPGGSSSASNATRMAALWTATGTTTSGSLQQAVVGFSTTLGSNASEATAVATATATQVNTATTNLGAVAGVSSDQQAVDLTNYQQAYQAAAQVISAAHTMFESLLTAI